MDEQELETWLNTRPREDAILIAQRAALRVFPIWASQMGQGWARDRDLTSGMLLRCYLTSGVARKYPTPEARAATFAAAATTTTTNYAGAFSTTDAVFAAAFAAAAAAGTTATAVAADATANAAAGAAAAVAAGAFWASVERDVAVLTEGKDLLPAELWHVDAPEQILRAEVEGLENLALETGDTNSFWHRWYYAAKRGEWLDWELQRDVALIPDEVWNQGPKAVMAAIAEIELRYRLDAVIRDTPYALRVEFDRQTRKLFSVPSEPADLQALIAAISQALEDFNKRCKSKSGGNLGASLLHATGPIFRALRRDLKRYANEPLFLFDALNDCRTELAALRRYEAFDGHPIFDRLLIGLERYSDDICRVSEAVSKTERGRAGVQLARFSQHQIGLAIEVSNGMAGDSQGLLLAAAGLAVQVLSDPGRSDEDRRAAWYFVRAMVPRGARTMLEHRADVAADSPKPKKGKLELAAEIGGHLDKIDKGVDAVQEFANELPAWVEAAGNLLGSLPSLGP